MRTVGGAWGLAAAVAPGVAGCASLLVLPMLVAALAAAHGDVRHAAGGFASVQSWSTSAGCLVSLVLARRVSLPRLAAGALAIVLAADLASGLVSTADAFLRWRAVGGLCGGIAMSVSTAELARLPFAEKSFGWSVLAQLIFALCGGLLISWGSAFAAVRWGFGVLAAADLSALLLVVAVSPMLTAVSERAAGGPPSVGRWWRPGAVLLAIVCFYIGIGACWPWVEEIGLQSGLSAGEAGRYVSLAAVGGLAGALAPAFLMRFAGRSLPIGVAAVALLGAMLLWLGLRSPGVFLLSTGLYYFGWYALVPCLFGTLASVDTDGRPTLASMALVGIGIGVGAALVGSGARASVVFGIETGIVATLIAAGMTLLVTHWKWRVKSDDT